VSGAEVRRFRGEASVCLRAGDYAAVFLPELGMLGASLTWRGVELLSLHGGLAAYRRGSTTGLPLLAPWANRLSKERFPVAGEEVDLRRLPVKRDARGLPIHGTMTGRREWTVVRLAPGRLTTRFEYSDPELLSAFPFPHELELDVRLPATGLTVTTTARPTGDTAVPISFGWHPYFKVGGPRSEWELQLPARERFALDTRGIPSGRSATETAGTLSLDGVALDDLYGLGEDRRFVLCGRSHAVEIRFGPGYPYAQLFAPAAKRFVAIEPMTAPTDALVTGDCRLVEPAAEYTAAFGVRAR
jgi:aldose 1-epimerase